MKHQGGCLCGALRYETTGVPARVSICHCRFCQRATGGAFLVEPIFDRSAHRMTGGVPSVYDQVSAGSGKVVHVHFCPDCGTKIALTFERFPDVIGVFGGTFDDPDWFDRSGPTARHIFVAEAQPGTVIPAGVNTYPHHALQPNGDPNDPVIYDSPHVIAAP